MGIQISTIGSPEFINLQPYNPLISQCEIKVLYLGKNRNHSFISKEVATDMANSLPGSPIVGYYKQEAEDFRDHGSQITLDADGVHCDCLTKPYGFVAPDAKVWFQDFEVQDELGNSLTRTYLMTTGYLWTGQYEEAKAVVEHGKGQSMELDEESLSGHWTEDQNQGVEFFIINDAIFSKLCILGDDIEPCFEEAGITAPDISLNFSKIGDKTFQNTLYKMMHELQFALEGGKQMGEETNNLVVEENLTEDAKFAKKDEEEKNKDKDKQESEKNPDKNDKEDKDKNKKFTEEGSNSEDFAKKDDEKDKDKEEENKKEPSKDNDDVEDKDKDDKEKEEKDKKHYSAEEYALLENANHELSAELESLKAQFSELQSKFSVLDLAQKQEKIDEFTTLDEEDKADVVANISKYTVDEIESKLATILYRKQVKNKSTNGDNFNNNIEEITTYSLSGNESTSLPAFIKAVKETQKRNREDN